MYWVSWAIIGKTAHLREIAYIIKIALILYLKHQVTLFRTRYACWSSQMKARFLGAAHAERQHHWTSKHVRFVFAKDSTN